ncbi:MAG: PEGA domain-containing protein [bacterium]
MIRLAPALVIWAGVAVAAPVRVAVLSTSPPRDARLARLVDGGREALARVDGLAGVDVAGLLDPASARPAVEARLQEARSAYENLEVEAALAILDATAPALVAAGAVSEAARAYELVARIRLGLRDTEGAVAACRMWLRLEDPPTLDTAAAPPSLLEALAAAIEPPVPAALRVEATVPALVRIDGRRAGITPVTAEVAAGLHVVSVEADGFQRGVYVVRPRADLGVAVLARLRPAERGQLLDEVYGRLDGQLDADAVGPGLRDLRALVAAEQAVLVEAGAGVVRAALFDLQAGRRVRIVELPEGDAGAAAQGGELVRLLYSGLDPQAPGLAAPEIEVSDPRPYHHRWWFWPAVAAASIAAVAIPVALLSEDEAAGLTRRPGTGAVIIRF